MTTEELCRKWGMTVDEVEALRAEKSGYFTARVVDSNGNEVQGLEVSDNIVTNEGLNYILDIGLSGGTQITAWYVTLAIDDVAAAAGMTYATPTFAEITGTQVSEATRQAWTDGGVTSQSVDNSASPATYTADTTFTAYAAALVGGGAAASTLDDSAGGGTLYAYSQFASAKALTASDTIEVTYTFTAADDGV